jgi:hypothetical protein
VEGITALITNGTACATVLWQHRCARKSDLKQCVASALQNARRQCFGRACVRACVTSLKVISVLRMDIDFSMKLTPSVWI